MTVHPEPGPPGGATPAGATPGGATPGGAAPGGAAPGGAAPGEQASLAGVHPLRQRLGEQVASLLLTAIRLYEFLPDERLPPENELCAQLGVNRMAVREGLRWLEDHRYIRIQRGRYGGAYVVQPALDVAVERLRGMAVNFRQLFEYRAAIEPLTAELAAERIGPTELARLDRLHEIEMQQPSIATGSARSTYPCTRSWRAPAGTTTSSSP
jgi:DNA-binding transcriptional regulator YhcF (GntR family)